MLIVWEDLINQAGSKRNRLCTHVHTHTHTHTQTHTDTSGAKLTDWVTHTDRVAHTHTDIPSTHTH